MQWVYFHHSGSLLKWFHPADGNTSKSPMSSSDVSKRLLENSLDSWMETGEMTNEPLVPSSPRLSFTLSSCPRCQRTPPFFKLLFFLFTPSLLVSPVPFFPLTAPFTQICYCHGEMSHCFQPFQPYFTFLSPPCRHLLSPRPPAASRSLRQSFGCYCQLRHSFQPRSDPVQTPSLNNPHLSSAPRPCCRLLFCHLSVSVSISSRCNRGLCSCISETEHFRLAPSGRSARKMSLWNTSRLVQLRREPKYSSSDSPSGSKLSDLQVWYNNW